MAVLHRVLDDPAEAGIVENAMVYDEAEGAAFITPPYDGTRRPSRRWPACLACRHRLTTAP
jgi:hypothetical protein